MKANIQTITLDLTNSAYSAAQKVFVVQGDSGTRPVKAVITDNGMVRTDLSHESVCLYIDNNGDRPTYVEGISVVNGVAEFNIPQSAVLNAGTEKAELRFIDEENRVLTSVSFMVEVAASVYDEKALLGTDDGDVLIRMVEQTEKSEAAAAKSAEEAKNTADNLVGNVNDAIEELKAAKERGDFNGISVTHQWDGTVLTVTSASGKSSSDLKGDKGEDGADYILTEDDKNEIAAKANAVSYSVTQDLTKEQKEIARNNIDAVDANLVVSSLSRDEQIPNGAALKEYVNTAILQESVSTAEEQNFTDAQKALACSNIGAVSTGDVVSNCVSDGKLLSDKIPNAYAMYEFLKSYAVVANVTQSLSDEKKARARENIGAAKEQGTWELLFTITGDGTTRLWEMTELSDGSPISLSEVACNFNNEVASAKNGVACLTASAIKNNTSTSYQINSVMTGVGVNTNTAVKSFHRIFPLNGYWHGESAVGSSGTVNNCTSNATYAIKFPLAEYPKITAIKVYTQETTPLPEGSTVTVWGIRI